MIFGVITEVPNPLEPDEHGNHLGNLANGPELYVEISDDNSKWEDRRYEGFFDWVLAHKEALGVDAIKAISMIQYPVFEKGEILILDGEFGREIVGPGRKPSKWFVTCEHFNSIEAAVARAQEVRGW